MKKIITLNSGGMDSLIALKRMHDQGYEQHSIYVDMGQPNGERAKASAKKIADQYCISHEVITLVSDSRSTFSTSNQIINKSTGIRERVPYTNLIFPLISAIACVCDDVECLSFGGYKPIIPGDTPLTIQTRIETLLNRNVGGQKVKLLQPLNNCKTFEDSVNAGLAQGLTLEELGETVSCASAEPCGECGKCKARSRMGIRVN